MALFQVTDYDKRVYEEELKDFLPEKLIDIHTHIWLTSLRPRGTWSDEKAGLRQVTWPSRVASQNSIEDLMETYRLMFPDKQVTPLLFTSGKPPYLDGLNEYVRQSGEKTGAPTLYYSHPRQSGEELERKIREGGFLGLKSYLSLSPEYIPEAEIRIFDFFPPEQLKKMDEMGAIVMLHIPRHGRLKDPVNLAQILEIKQRFPRVRLIVAHIGRAYAVNDVGNAFEVLSPCKDLMFDFCANTSEYAMTKLLEAVGPNRAMFGSDMPILRMRMRRIEENNTYVNLVPPGLYGDISGDPHMREVSPEEAERLTFFMYEEIRAFKRACANVGFTKADVERCFYLNAKELIDGARRDIFGK